MKCMFYPEIDCPSYAAQKELGYEPRTDLGTGIKNTVNWYKKENWL